MVSAAAAEEHSGVLSLCSQTGKHKLRSKSAKLKVPNKLERGKEKKRSEEKHVQRVVERWMKCQRSDSG